MQIDKPRITAQIAGRALHPLLRPFAIGYFLAVCMVDVVYSQASILVRYDSAEIASITEWLLGVGLLMIAATALVALIDYVGDRRIASLPDLGMYAAGTALVGALEFYNLDIRWADGTAAILPMGIILSFSAVIVMFATPTQAWARAYR
jgi:uncharacterized membrane protein